MARTLGRNKHQKAARRRGELRISRAQVGELLQLSRSDDADKRLTAAKYMCPCHIRGRLLEVWDAIYGLMEDTDARVRLQAWHTLEDGGLPEAPEAFARLEALFARERDEGVRSLAEEQIGPALEQRRRRDITALRRPITASRGKCDFCGERDRMVDRDLDTMIPTSDLPRPALICRSCATARVARAS